MISILRDPEAVSGGRKKSKWVRKKFGGRKVRNAKDSRALLCILDFFPSNFSLTHLSLFPHPNLLPLGLLGCVISKIIKVKVMVISWTQRLRLITLTETLTILDITKTESNNCYIIHWTKKMEDLFLFLHWQEATQSAQTWHDNPWPWVDNCIIWSYDVIGTDFENTLYVSANQKRVRDVQCILILDNPQFYLGNFRSCDEFRPIVWAKIFDGL